MVNCEGPTIEFLPAVPQCPARGAVNAAGFRYRPGAAARTAAPVVSGRILPVTPVPTTATAYTRDAASPPPPFLLPHTPPRPSCPSVYSRSLRYPPPPPHTPESPAARCPH